MEEKIIRKIDQNIIGKNQIQRQGEIREIVIEKKDSTEVEENRYPATEEKHPGMQQCGPTLIENNQIDEKRDQRSLVKSEKNFNYLQ